MKHFANSARGGEAELAQATARARQLAEDAFAVYVRDARPEERCQIRVGPWTELLDGRPVQRWGLAGSGRTWGEALLMFHRWHSDGQQRGVRLATASERELVAHRQGMLALSEAKRRGDS